ncbi:MAG: hypothetical protein ACYCRH_08125 [Acidiferrobacteraceae bacterium]
MPRWRIPLLAYLTRALPVIAVALAAGGCASVEYASLGHVMTGYTQHDAIPYLQSTDDPRLSCGAALGLDQLLASFQTVMARPRYDLMYTEMLAATCSERRAFRQDLRVLRAVRDHRVATAQDARIAEARDEVVTARRRYRAWQDLVAHYGTPGKQCPQLTGRANQLAYLMGLATGLQALLNDARSGEQVGVPRDIALKAAHASRCLSNRKWWGVPGALRASVWTILPGAAPAGTDPWKEFQTSSALAERSGVRLAIAMYAIAAQNQGKSTLERDAIAQFARAGRRHPAPRTYRLIDRLAAFEVRHLSDRIWTQETGARTPAGALGTFPGAPAEGPPLKGLLHGLGR